MILGWQCVRQSPISLGRWLSLLFVCLVGWGWAGDATAVATVRQEIGGGAFAVLRNGRLMFLECSLPSGDRAQGVLQQYLADPEQWKAYRNRMAVAIPFSNLNAKTQRTMLEAVFPKDYVDDAGWWHMAAENAPEGTDTLWAIAEWLTGVGTQYRKILNHALNRDITVPLKPGQKLLVPRALLKPAMQVLTPKPVSSIEPVESLPEGELVAPAAANGELEYGKDHKGSYAAYRLKKGEALYSAVVVRFTDFSEKVEIQSACEIVQKRSGIRDVRKMNEGQRILIPLDILSDRYQPVGSEERAAFEEVREEARRLQADRVRTKDLDGVVVILDPGHGGRDQGAPIENLGLYEDELNYDISCRIKTILEQETRAKVYMTLKDASQGYDPVSNKRFSHDTDEVLLTSPEYNNDEAKYSANLRWYLANSIYRKEKAAGVDDRKIIFASIHCDALYNETLRGAMIYIPGAKYYDGEESRPEAFYNRFAEVHGHRSVSINLATRRRQEALSNNFAEEVLAALRAHNPGIKVHSAGVPIRNVIRQSGRKTYVPAVLRGTMIPTRILIECANLTNPADQERTSDPDWRQWFAEAFVAALRKHFA